VAARRRSLESITDFSMPDIFLSYSRDDQAIARYFAEGFERAGFSVWWDQTLNAGEDYDEVTEKALEEARAVVVLWSRKSVGSRWVRAEATQADRSGTLVPAMIEACKRPIMFELKQTADLSAWAGDPEDKAWQAYLASVRRLVEKGSPATPSPVPSPTIPARPRRIGPIWVALGVALLLASGAGLWMLGRTGPKTVAGAETDEPVSLAVLPFVNMSSDPEQEYFSDGLTEEILNHLAQIKDLRVTGRTSSFSFKGKDEDLREIGRKLGVANILEGSVRKSGDRLRIVAQLIDSRDGAHLWSQTFERNQSEVFAIQDEVARSVANALRVTLVADTRVEAGSNTANPEAYDKYLRAMALQNSSLQGNQRAAQLLREAVTLDPDYVAAWFGLRRVLINTETWNAAESSAAREELKSVRARLEDLAINTPTLRGMLSDELAQQRNWSAAEVEARAALETGTGSASAIGSGRSLAFFLWYIGRPSEAIEYFERAVFVDPLARSPSVFLQILLDTTGRPEEAQAEYLRGKDLVGEQTAANWNAVRRIWSRESASSADIRAQLQVYLQSERQPMSLDLFIADNFADREAVLAKLREAIDDPANQVISRLNRIVRYADHFGDRDVALEALRRQYIDHKSTYFSYLWDPFETQLRADPRFKQILRDMGLVDYFRASGKWNEFCKPVGKDDFECR
jgi:TolB-like protein